MKQSIITQSGLTIVGKTFSDTEKIMTELDHSCLHYEFDAIEGYFFLPEEEESYDALEIIVSQILDSLYINYRLEGIF